MGGAWGVQDGRRGGAAPGQARARQTHPSPAAGLCPEPQPIKVSGLLVYLGLRLFYF